MNTNIEELFEMFEMLFPTKYFSILKRPYF